MPIHASRSVRQVRQHHVEHPDRARPWPADCCRCRTSGTARRTGSRPRSRTSAIASRVAAQPRRRRPRTPARRSRRRPGGRRRRRPSAPRCPGAAAVDRPPMSHRSQVATSGSRPIAACSAACSAPGTSGRLDPGARQRLRRQREPDRHVRSVAGGRSSGRVSITSPVPMPPPLVRRPPGWSRRPRRGTGRPVRRPRRSGPTTTDRSVTSRAWVDQSGSSACDQRAPRRPGRARRPRTRRPGAGRPRRRARWKCAEPASTVPSSRPVADSTTATGAPPVPRRSTSGRPGAASTSRSGRWRSAPAATSAVDRRLGRGPAEQRQVGRR